MTQSASHTWLHISWYNQHMQSLRLGLLIVFANELLSVGQFHAWTRFPLATLLASLEDRHISPLIRNLDTFPSAVRFSQTVQQRSVPSSKGPNTCVRCWGCPVM